MTYEAVFYNGWVDPPGYFLIDAVEGDTPEDALLANLEHLIQQVRDLFYASDSEPPDERIREMIYVLRANALVSAVKAERAR